MKFVTSLSVVVTLYEGKLVVSMPFYILIKFKLNKVHLAQKHLSANRGDSVMILIFNVKLKQEFLVKIPTHRDLRVVQMR